MQQTAPASERLHIGIIGNTNSGKSSLFNILTGQHAAIVSSRRGTTTDTVRKNAELPGIGPVVFIDTAGFGDDSELGAHRMEKTQEAILSSDILLCVFSPDTFSEDKACLEWIKQVRSSKKTVIPVLAKSDVLKNSEYSEYVYKIIQLLNKKPVFFSSFIDSGRSKSEILKKITESVPEDFCRKKTFTRNLCTENDTVLLVMPQDSGAPKGRLILPQVQILRELLDKKCIVSCCTADKLTETLSGLKKPPELIITDSKVFRTVYEQKPERSVLTSFSILMAAEKGDISRFLDGAAAIERLTADSKVLIAEACTHVPLEEDIGRKKIPDLLRKRIPGIQIDFMNGTDFPDFSPAAEKNALRQYDLIIHCGACMFNAVYVKARQESAARAGIPLTNYGIAIAYLTGILSHVAIP